MRVVAFGEEPVGVIAIGANATGIIAIGQLATGVVAIGQLARGAIVVGQLGLGLVAIGQLAVGAGWSAGMVGIGGTAGPGLIAGAFGRLSLLRLFGRHTGRALEGTGLFSRARLVVGLIVTVALAALWWLAAGQWVMDALTRTGGILFDPPRVLR